MKYLFCVLLLGCSAFCFAQASPSALELTDSIEADLLHYKQQMLGLKQTLQQASSDLNEQTDNLQLLLNDYLALENNYQTLSDSLTSQLRELTAQYQKSEHSAGFWKKCSVVLAVTTALLAGTMVMQMVF